MKFAFALTFCLMAAFFGGRAEAGTRFLGQLCKRTDIAGFDHTCVPGYATNSPTPVCKYTGVHVFWRCTKPQCLR